MESVKWRGASARRPIACSHSLRLRLLSAVLTVQLVCDSANVSTTRVPQQESKPSIVATVRLFLRIIVIVDDVRIRVINRAGLALKIIIRDAGRAEINDGADIVPFALHFLNTVTIHFGVYINHRRSAQGSEGIVESVRGNAGIFIHRVRQWRGSHCRHLYVPDRYRSQEKNEREGNPHVYTVVSDTEIVNRAD